MRKAWLGLALVALGVAAPATGAGAAGGVEIQASNFRFCDGAAAMCLPTDTATQTMVPAGTTVTWVYKDTGCDAVVPCPGHNVTFADLAGKTIKQEGAVLLTRTFTAPGQYAYRCTIHEGFGMTGTIVVQAAAAGSGEAGGPATSPGGSPAAPAVAGTELPRTGAATAALVGLAVVLLVLGATTRRLAATGRRRA